MCHLKKISSSEPSGIMANQTGSPAREIRSEEAGTTKKETASVPASQGIALFLPRIELNTVMLKDKVGLGLDPGNDFSLHVCNLAFTTLLGGSPPDARGLALSECLKPMGVAGIHFWSQLVSEGHATADFAFKIEETARFIKADYHLLADQEGRVVEIIGVCTDVTDQRTIQDELNRFSSTVDLCANVVMITDTSGRIEYVNPAFTRLTGYTSEEVIGRKPNILKSGMQSPTFYQHLWQCLLKGEQWTGDFQNRKKNGELFWETAIITPLKNREGEIVRFVAIKENITRQRQAEQSLRDNEEQYRSMAANIPGVLYRAAPDTSHTMHYLTDAIATLSGYDASDFLFNSKRTYLSVIHPEDRKKMLETLARDIAVSGQYMLEYRIIASDGTVRWVSDNGRAVFDDQQQPRWLDGFIFDTSERVTVLEEMKKARIIAEEANLAKSEFLANISHEIRTPLNAVLGFADLLEGMTMDAVQKKYLDSIKSSGKSLMTLINDLLDLSRIEAGKYNISMAPLDMRNLLAEVHVIFDSRAAQKGISFTHEINADFPAEIIFDETRLRQILINLVGNAIKFTHAGQVKLLVAGNRDCPSDTDPAINLNIRICDTGIGIPAESFSAIFQSFRQESQLNSRRYEGTGLGLAITKRLVEAMNGTITVESEVNRGSCFTVCFNGVACTTERTINSMNISGNVDASSATADSRIEPAEPCPVSPDEFQELLNKLEKKMYRRWKHFENKKPLKEIRAFALEIIKIGRQANVRFIAEYGEQLFLTIENFDIEEMRLKLEEFPSLVRRLKKRG